MGRLILFLSPTHMHTHPSPSILLQKQNIEWWLICSKRQLGGSYSFLLRDTHICCSSGL